MKLTDYQKFHAIIYMVRILILFSLALFLLEVIPASIAGFKAGSMGDKPSSSITVRPINPEVDGVNISLPYTISEMEITFLSEKEDIFHILRFTAIIFGMLSLIWYFRAIKNSFKTLNVLAKNGLWMEETTKYLGRTAQGLLIAVICYDLGNYLYQLHHKKTINIPGFEVIMNFEPSVPLLLTGLILMLFTWILKFGQQLKLEQDLTI